MKTKEELNHKKIVEKVINKKITKENPSSYPIIKFPSIISNYFSGKIPDLIPLPKPIEPKKENEFSEALIFLLLFIILSLVTYFLYKYKLSIFFEILSLMLTIFIPISYFLIRKEQKNKMQEFRKQLEKHEDSIVKVELLKKELGSSDNRINFIIKRIKEEAKKGKPVLNSYTTKTGISENFFQRKLKEIFGDSIYKDRSFSTSEYSPMPDFTFYNGEILIDIEIDEPYDFINKKPIHYFDTRENSHDNSERDKEFNDRNWFVIRFTEKQICETPEECMTEIAFLIYIVTNNIEFILKLPKTNRVPKTPFWTKEDANIMASKNYRKTYINRCKNISSILD